MATKNKKAKRKSAGISLTPFLIIAGIIGLALTVYIGYRASISDRKLLSISLIALFAGLLFESIRVSGSWKTVIAIFVGTYLFSLFAFLPGKHEHAYNFENHIEMWPYFFIFIFALFFGIVYKDKVTAKLTEGITLLLSISLIYWAVDYGFMNYQNWFSISLITIGLLLSIFSIINALTHIHLSRINRLILSIWSTVVMFAFAVDNIIHVFSNPDIESSYISDGLYISLQYFLLGVSVVYIMQNYMLLAAFLPSKNSNYRRDLKENKKDHIDRYSDEQVNIGQSLFCIVFTGTVYLLNHKFQLLPRHTMIWLVFLTFPLILHLTTLINGKKTTANIVQIGD
ncbi:hypothetical protein [Pedobacter gandavensis]|uniref:hypothetical protein n=1 Tax=Pedobacter gandavensis TaxID=2679963 RepID=UPI002930E34E|nr:hypothetical protein [Pedobacter gandavensis]